MQFSVILSIVVSGSYPSEEIQPAYSAASGGRKKKRWWNKSRKKESKEVKLKS